ncbi:hypothetical protein [Defluviitalea phaphyphila]|uniref:hypothetical protein n=1 Tax=Defluviitalea phaphyphila TaxID=1473580 RepID=UPI0007DC1F8B|nr:hypothetical protein [Defluviitalea phaphyphila]
MSNGFYGRYGYGYGYGYGGILYELSKFIGETITIFTNSGGQSGSGFTGVLIGVNPYFVTLVTGQGPAPYCPLGNACGGYSNWKGYNNCGNYHEIYTTGSITHIPVYMIASFSHNTV